MLSPLLLLVATAAAGSASPGPLRLGIDVGMGLDLPDGAGTARFAPGPTLAVPVRLPVSDHARLVGRFRTEFATGRDRVLWSEVVAGETVTFYDDDHFAMPVVGALTVGAEIVAPTDGGIEVALSVETGAAWVGTYHSFGGPTQVLLDPAQNDLDDPTNVDPYTTQVAWINGVEVGAAIPFRDRLHLTVRTGYSGTFLSARPLRKTPAALDARRAAYGWNPWRLTVGIEKTL